MTWFSVVFLFQRKLKSVLALMIPFLIQYCMLKIIQGNKELIAAMGPLFRWTFGIFDGKMLLLFPRLVQYAKY